MRPASQSAAIYTDDQVVTTSEDDRSSDEEVVRDLPVDEQGQYFSSLGVSFVINPTPKGEYIYIYISENVN